MGTSALPFYASSSEDSCLSLLVMATWFGIDSFAHTFTAMSAPAGALLPETVLLIKVSLPPL